MYEVATKKIAFQNDWSLFDYCHSTENLNISDISHLPEYIALHLSETLAELLHGDWEKRPRAPVLRRLFLCFTRLHNRTPSDIKRYPSYIELKILAIRHQTDIELLNELRVLINGDVDPVQLRIAKVLTDYESQEANEITNIERQIITNIEYIDKVSMRILS